MTKEHANHKVLKQKSKYCYDLAKQLSYYLYLLFFWTYYTGRSMGKCHITSVT